MDLRTPKTFNGSWVEAHALAKAELEPIFVPVTPFADDRGWSLMNLLAGAMSDQGQINFSMQYPGAIKAWHRHDLQTDFWTCITGSLKVGVHRDSDQVSWLQVMGDRKTGVLVIPPPLWHGATVVGPDSAGLLYYMTHQFNHEKPDEHRMPWDGVEGFPWGIRHT